MSRYDEIKKGLMEAIAYERGELKDGVTVRHMSVASLRSFTPGEIRQIRLDAQMTQSTFAACIGVTKKAVEAWEGGRSKPDGAARRTLGLMQSNPRFADEAGIIVR
ncbi:MAG: transcriptional regulator [Clostridia bacterium]|nr:transcriptional regulator [Clostridia bacterium]